jgi:hypothetical protein
MATQATTVLGDLHKQIEALLGGRYNPAWAASKALLESIECAGTTNLPTRGEVAAVLCQILARELAGTVRGARASDI